MKKIALYLGRGECLIERGLFKGLILVVIDVVKS